MKSNLSVSVKKQIKTLLAVLFVAVMFAFLMTSWMVRKSSSAPYYLLKNILLSPKVAESLVRAPVIFDHIEYTAWEESTKGWKSRAIDLSVYQKLYRLIENDHSIEPSLELQQDFLSNPSNLSLFIQKANHLTTPLQILQFGKSGHYFRVEVPMETREEKDKWAYFFHEGIKKKWMEILSSLPEG